MSDAYQELHQKAKRIGILTGITGALQWDQEVLLTEQARSIRAQELGAVSAIKQNLLTDKRIGELLHALEDKELDEDQNAVVREVTRRYERQQKVPEALAQEIAEAASDATEIWRGAREDDDYQRYLPALKKNFALARKYAAAIDPEEDPYQVLFEEYEPGMRIQHVTKMFTRIKQELAPLIKKISNKQAPRTDFLEHEVREETQKELAHELARRVGYDFGYGRIDEAPHPFTTRAGGVRFTIRYSDGYAFTMRCTAHEAGHALYEQGLPKEHYGTPLGHYRSLGVHESQSRLWENHVCASKPFLESFYPLMQERISHLADVSLEEYHRAISKVEPTHIRVLADELTYPMHIILRYELEQELIREEITEEDLPELWNKKSEQLLGLTLPDDTRGVLQDVHWSWGNIGYFATYLLGSVLAAQLYAAAKRDIPDLEDRMRQGETQPLLDWLRENVHRHGQRYETEELIQRATGKPLAADDYLEYLTQKYEGLYGL